ncbi:MAG: hypothetical protein BWY71_01965 [Planctomycetes bacterium ADurb.Bin412]|nr:MAG: hypothetical protein BWY71_01965 [Planctomycetes bacterium ADurb.Bin412]
MLALRRILNPRAAPAAIAAIPDGDPMPPPELAADAPVPHPPQPVQIGIGVAGRMKGNPAAFDRFDRRLSQRLDFDIPLIGKVRLNRYMRTIAMAHLVDMLHHLLDQAQTFQIRHHRLAGLVAVQSLVLAAVFVDAGVRVQDVDLFQMMPQSDFIVVGVMGRRNLQEAGALPPLNIIIGDNRDDPVRQGQFHHLAHHRRRPLILRIHRHRRIPQHGFRPGRRHHHIPAALRQRIADMPEIPLHFHMLHFIIRQGRLRHRVPVDQPLAPVNQPLAI